MDKKIIVLIPARGGSKGIPKKNIKKFMGSPLIVHTINYALSCHGISDVYVTTDNLEISEISKNAGAKIIDRPSNISTDTATTESAIEHALSQINIKPDIIVLLQPTSPLRPEGSLEKGIKKFISEGYDSLLSISPTHKFFWGVSETKTTPKYDYLNRPRRQDLNQNQISYIENGSLYIFSYNHFQKVKNRLGGKIGHIIFPEEYSMEIDTELDFEILQKNAELLKND